MIIGADQYHKIMLTQTVDEITLLPSKLGYLTAGSAPSPGQLTTANESSSHVTQVTISSLACTSLFISTDPYQDELSRLFSLDTIGIHMDSPSAEDVAAMDDFSANISYDGTRYTAKLPWKSPSPRLPDNYNLSYNRLTQLLNRLRTQPDILNHYNAVIKDHLNQGFIEKVDTKGPVHHDKVHYLPHHAVRKYSATTPLRVVFDCSAHATDSSPSLNSLLARGPTLVQELGKLLVLYRTSSYAAAADITKAYLMVQLHIDDRDATRFLWPDDPHDRKCTYTTYRFKTVLFGATCSQFLLNATLRHHLSLSDDVIAKAILDRIYIDNVYYTHDNEESIVNFYHKSKELLKQAGFTLCQWATNSELLNTQIAANNDGAKLDDENPTISILGLRWNTKFDTLGYQTPVDLTYSPERLTKRQVVSTSSKIYNPLGLITPVTIRSRMFVQELWKSKSSWDDPLNDDQVDTWTKLANDLAATTNVTYKRQVTINKTSDLHVFCDSSMKAYGSVIYVVTGETSDLLIAKSRVVSIKCPTLPQLELTSVSIGVRLANYAIDALSNKVTIANVHVWSDSEISLAWIRSTKPLKPYVQNRVDEIKRLLPNAVFHHVSSGDNPADLLSRGMSAKSFAKSSLWWNGLVWLTNPHAWPISLASAGAATSCPSFSITHANPVEPHSAHPTLFAPADVAYNGYESEIIVSQINVTQPPPLIDIDRFSDLRKLIRVTAYVCRLIDRLRRRTHNQESTPRQAHLTVEEQQEAEILLIKQVQARDFASEFAYLNGETTKKPNLVRQLRLMIQDGILRCGGRKHESNLPYDTRCPSLLPSHDNFISLLIREKHKEVLHDTLTQIRQRYWISAARQKVRSEIQRCFDFKRLHSRPYYTPDVANQNTPSSHTPKMMQQNNQCKHNKIPILLPSQSTLDADCNAPTDHTTPLTPTPSDLASPQTNTAPPYHNAPIRSQRSAAKRARNVCHRMIQLPDDNDVEHKITPSRWSHRFSSQQVLEHYLHIVTEKSNEAKSSQQCELAIPYDDGPLRKLDIFGLETLPKDAPILVYIHGGFWQAGSRVEASFPAIITVHAGIVYIAMGYDLAPSASMSTILESVQRAMAHVCDMAYNADGSYRNVYVFGHSAGAHLAAMTLLSTSGYITDRHLACVKGLILVSGVFDLHPIVGTSINTAVALTWDQAARFSPQLLDVSDHWMNDGQSVIVAYAQHEPPTLHEQSLEYHKKLTAAGVKSELTEVADTDHFNVVERLVDEGYSLFQDLLRMIGKENKHGQ